MLLKTERLEVIVKVIGKITLSKGDVDTDLLEAMYFGKISDITVTTDEENLEEYNHS